MATIQNLVGTNKIKDEWQKINDNFASLNNSKLEKNGADKLNFATSGPALTISNGAITVSRSFYIVDTEGGEPTDELDTIHGGSPGDVLFLRQNVPSRKITIRHQGGGTGNIRTFDATDVEMMYSTSLVQLICVGSLWYVVGVQGVKRSGDTMTGRLQINNQLYYGTGSPEGNLTASPGSIYQNLSGGTGTTLYYKASGTGNTGWVAIA